MSTPRPPRLDVVSLKLSQETLRVLNHYSKGSTVSATGRKFMEFGMEQLIKPGAIEALDLRTQLDRLEELAARWPGGLTPAGSRDCPTPAHLPDPTSLRPGEVVVARGCAVILTAVGGVLTIDLDDGELAIVTDDGNWGTPIDRPALALLVPALAGALMAMATRPGAVRLPLGLVIERGEGGAVLIHGGDRSLAIDALAAYQWSAELSALLVARLRRDGTRVMQLEGAMAASPDLAEVER